jgi:predicted heme/steroid binding protein/uncharacterized membrane protein
MKEFSAQELEKHNGEDGNPVYIAHQGKVYDVSGSKLWKTGLHMKRHPAGKDLTTDIQAAPHNIDVLERYPQVGVLTQTDGDGLEPKMPPFVSKLISRFPMLRRHPHPMTVHFPIVFFISTTLFNILYLLTGIKSFETTALHCLAGGILFGMVAMSTGFYTWWMNYLSQPMRAVVVKRRVGLLLLGSSIVVFIWRVTTPGILDRFTPGSVVYLLLVLSLFVQVSIMGWFGASLTFPAEKE